MHFAQDDADAVDNDTMAQRNDEEDNDEAKSGEGRGGVEEVWRCHLVDTNTALYCKRMCDPRCRAGWKGEAGATKRFSPFLARGLSRRLAVTRIRRMVSSLQEKASAARGAGAAAAGEGITVEEALFEQDDDLDDLDDDEE